MELLLFTAGAVLLGLAAQRWGYDSRPGFVSKEHELARQGVTWAERVTFGRLDALALPLGWRPLGGGALSLPSTHLYSRHRPSRRRPAGRGPRPRLRG